MRAHVVVVAVALASSAFFRSAPAHADPPSRFELGAAIGARYLGTPSIAAGGLGVNGVFRVHVSERTTVGATFGAYRYAGDILDASGSVEHELFSRTYRPRFGLAVGGAYVSGARLLEAGEALPLRGVLTAELVLAPLAFRSGSVVLEVFTLRGGVAMNRQPGVALNIQVFGLAIGL